MNISNFPSFTKTDFFPYLLTVIVMMILPIGCHRNTVKIAPLPDSGRFEIPGVINSHLYEWRQAEISYEKEFNIRPAKEIEDKLRQIRFLVLIRQIEEDIPDSRADERIGDICAGNEYDKRLCEIAKWIQNGKKAEELKRDFLAFTENDPVFESYITLLLFQAIPQFDVFPSFEYVENTKQSPLFLYMNPRGITFMEPSELEKNYPDFAEGFVVLAEQFFRKNKYRIPLEFYQKALELIPDYTKAYLGIGDIYYALEDYERAMHHYNMALRYAPSDITAMYRKGLALYQMGRHEESNDAIERMLRLDVARYKQNEWINGVPSAQYYQGQGYYIKAYNYYLLGDPVKSREFVDIAKKQLPRFAEPIYLSGILFYESHELESARREFLSILDGRNCSVPLHLGLIYEKLETENENNNEEASEHRSVPHFIETATCLDSGVRSLNDAINKFDFSEFEPAEQERMKSDMAVKLTKLKMSSRSTVEMIIRRIGEYVPEPEKQRYLKALNEILSRLDQP